MSVAIVIPAYKPIPDENEKLSLQQCQKVLSKYPRIIFHPVGLNLKAYTDIMPDAQFIAFNPDFFTNIHAYNKLMLSPSFYENFDMYRHILIYQLDAWVFEDRLQEWCKKGYDYIGAPDLDFVNSKSKFRNTFIGTFLMNGGLSLRNTKACLLMSRMYSLLYKRFYIGNEDSYFSAHYLRFFFIKYLLKLPDYKTALSFAFEKYPSNGFEKNNDKMPFGCHAYLKYEPEFWKSKGIKIV